ncbi:Peptide deformylase [hydrothermal vent metagenome]|uniref:Peptide deformylase n=1 Tax=hydrothermal vent metagenome TaxID=652676 RepID=A0A3B1A5T9_9ZZZZ
MSVKEILRMGHPLLKNIAKPVLEFNTAELDSLVEDMLDTMAALDGAGLAAPQIAVSLRVVIFGIDNNPRYPEIEPIVQTILINPEITIIGDKIESAWEGCLSIPKMRGLVARNSNIKYKGFDQFGNMIERSAEDFHARVVLHEVDHLDGILYPERIKDLKNFGFEDQLF